MRGGGMGWVLWFWGLQNASVRDTGVVLVVVVSYSPSCPSLYSPVMTRCRHKSSIPSYSHLLNFLDRCGLFQSLGLRRTRRPPYFSGKYSRYQPFACPNPHLPVVMEDLFRRKWTRITRSRYYPVFPPCWWKMLSTFWAIQFPFGCWFVVVHVVVVVAWDKFDHHALGYVNSSTSPKSKSLSAYSIRCLCILSWMC